MKYKPEDIDKKHPFKVPEGYFEHLPLKIQERTTAASQSRAKWALPQWSLAIGSAAAVILCLTLVLGDTSSPAEDILATVDEASLIAYIDEMELDEQEIITAFESEIEAMGLDDLMLEELEIDKLNDQTLDQFLLDYELEIEIL